MLYVILFHAIALFPSSVWCCLNIFKTGQKPIKNEWLMKVVGDI